MLFTGSITIPASTTEASPTTQLLTIRMGIISKIMVRPRPGHAGLAHLRMFHNEIQIAPTERDTDLHGDTFPIDWEEYYEIYQPAYQLKLVGWNEDDTYEHTFDVFVAILPKRATLAGAFGAIGEAFKGLLSPRRIFTGGR